ncbi:MAG TPA: hypothetical protein VKA58_11335 [Propionibacteriaceae bacterium]|nr:hypothetical protein [Propionibacteriaceae bacterium]
MLFLYRPRQTWMPFRPPRRRTDQDRYNLRMQQAYAATRRVAPYTPAAADPAEVADPVARLRDLARLHESGVLSDAEFAAAKPR